MNKVSDIKEVIQKIKSRSRVMVGGFAGSGVPSTLVKALIQYTDATDLTIINIDTGLTGSGLYELMKLGRTKKIIASHLSQNEETLRRIDNHTLEYELVPQGTLAERIRAAGAGLGGILTPTGVGTIIEQGKEKKIINEKEYLFELPLRADVALIHAEIADELGNLYMVGTARNSNEVMATAADYVIAEAYEIVPVGKLDPNLVTVPSIYVDAVVKVGE